MSRSSASGALSVPGMYAGMLRRIITGPRLFFRQYRESGNTIPAFYVLAASGTVYACASLLTYTCPQPFAALAIFFVNALGIPLLAAGIGYGLVRFIFGKSLSYGFIFGIYAYASAPPLLVAWTPYLVLAAEVWRWWLIGTGLIIVCELKRWEAFTVVGITIGCMIFGYSGAMSRLM